MPSRNAAEETASHPLRSPSITHSPSSFTHDRRKSVEWHDAASFTSRAETRAHSDVDSVAARGSHRSTYGTASSEGDDDDIAPVRCLCRAVPLLPTLLRPASPLTRRAQDLGGSSALEMSKKLLEVLSGRDEKRQQVRSLVQALHKSLVVEDEEPKVGPFPP